MTWLTQTIGIILIIIAAIDIFITVLYPRTGNSIISLPLILLPLLSPQKFSTINLNVFSILA
jgi:hypothetical protein